jgi:hypothetical protein
MGYNQHSLVGHIFGQLDAGDVYKALSPYLRHKD